MKNRENLQYLRLKLIKGTFTEKKNFLKDIEIRVKRIKTDFYINSNLERGNSERLLELQETII